jgi:hypothetical protein
VVSPEYTSEQVPRHQPTDSAEMEFLRNERIFKQMGIIHNEDVRKAVSILSPNKRT